MMKYLPANSSLPAPPHIAHTPPPPFKTDLLVKLAEHSALSDFFSTNFLLSSEMQRKKTPVTFDKMDVQRLFFSSPALRKKKLPLHVEVFSNSSVFNSRVLLIHVSVK